MKIVWNEQSARWFRSASEYTGYNKRLAQLLLERIARRDTLCDVGCGAGLIDVELAPYVKCITCVDISPEAVRAAEDNIRRYGTENVSALCADASTLEGQWDTVLALFYGGHDFMDALYPLAKDRLIYVTHRYAKGSFGPEKHRISKCSDCATTRAYLDGLGVSYTFTPMALEYGQPFTNRADARRFVQAYTTPMEQQELEAYLDRHLIRTEDSEFPLYLPKQKEFGIFVIRRDENENIQGRP